MLFSLNGMFIALMNSYAEVTFIRPVKIKSGKIRGVHEVSPLTGYC